MTGLATGGMAEGDLETSTNRPYATADGPPAASAVGDLAVLATTVQGLRRDLGQPSVRWSAPCLVTAIDFAVKVRGWPVQHAGTPCSWSPPTPRPAARCAWPKQDRGGTTPNDLA